MINRSDIRKEYYNQIYNKETDLSINKNTNIIYNETEREGIKLLFKEKLKDVQMNNEISRNNLEEVKLLLDSDIEKLDYKITKTVEKLRGAILVDRNTTSTIYSTIIPITQQQINTQTTTATISDNIIFGISDTIIDRDTITPLNLNNLSFKNLNLKSINKSYLDSLENFLITNKTHNSIPFEFTIDLRGLLKGTAAVILNLKDFAILEIYKNNSLFKEKALSNYFNIPVDLDTQSITIRAYPTIHKSSNLLFDIIGITEFIYQNNTVFETKQIPINKSLSNLVIDTCDNSRDQEVEIEYSISINNKEYERVIPSSKYNRTATNVQSIVTLSKDNELSLLEINGAKRAEGDIQYLLPNSLQNYIEYETYVYLPNINSLNNKELFILIKEDIYLHASLLSNMGSVYIDNILQTSDLFLLPKGLRSIKILDVNQNFVNINYDYLKTIIGEKNIFISKLLKPILKNIDGNKYVSLTQTELNNLYNSIDIKSIYIKDSKKEILVNTIKLKGTLKSTDKKTVPYISRILIRGI